MHAFGSEWIAFLFVALMLASASLSPAEASKTLLAHASSNL